MDAILTKQEQELLSSLQNNEHVLQMQNFHHHGTETVFDHCLHVVMTSLAIARLFSLSEDETANIIIGGMLHDFFLYDWHEGRIRKDGIHCWLHPTVALANAAAYFELNNRQRNIIRSHMFPATLLHPPRCKEAWIVSIADKICAIQEYINK
ncbi:MAG: HD domain-containing protein [Clostridia bacterium]|nr:HD domain-containing protein [Clostridia bacterium]